MALMGPGGGGGSEVGLDPQLFGDLITSLSSRSGNAQGLVSSYLGQLSRCGLDTSRLSAAAKDLTWAQDQLPMLNRRESLAQAWEQQHPGIGPMVPGGAGYLDFPTDKAAAHAGQSDGAKALQALEDHSNTDFIQSELAARGDDPAYLAAFFKALGPQGLAQLGLQVNGYQQQGNNHQYQLWASTVGTALATASYRMPFSDSWLNQLHLPGETDPPLVPELQLIQPFLENGVYSQSWLDPLGKYAMQQARLQALEPGLEQIPNLDGIWTAIAHNPPFDAKFYSQNFQNKDPNANYPPSLSWLMTNPMVQHSVLDSAFANMVQAATIPPDPSKYPGLNLAQFYSNAQSTVRYFGSSGNLHTSGDVQQALGQIAMNYFSDLAHTIGAAAPGVGNQNSLQDFKVVATQGDWANFITEAMQNKTEAARLLTFYSEWNKQNPPMSWVGQPDAPTHQGFWSNFSAGVLNDFMASSYQAAGHQAGTSADAIAEIAAAGGSAFLASLVFGPEAGVATALVEGGKDAFQTATENQLKAPFQTVLDSAFSNGTDKAGQIAASDLTNTQTIWEGTVRTWATSQGGLQPDGNVIVQPGVTAASVGGHPVQYYEQQYGGTFVDPSTHQLLPLDQIQHNPQALAAYNAWLQDPAVSYANAGEFSTKAQGQVWGAYARGFPAGGSG